MSKKKTICFYAMTAILFALIFIVAVFLRVKTFEYIILLILIAGLIYLKQSQRIVRLWQISLISIGLFFIVKRVYAQVEKRDGDRKSVV